MVGARLIDRRACVVGLGAVGAAGHAVAADKTTPTPELEPLFASGPLAKNLIAKMFKVPSPRLAWPDCRLIGPNEKPARLTDLRGRLLLVAMWAEWCTPCLTELPGLAYHSQRSNNDKFQIVPVLTASGTFYRPRQIAPLMEKIGAVGLQTYVDTSSADTILNTVCRDPRRPDQRGGVLPCMLIVDPQGQIVGRAVGSDMIELEDNKKHNLWSTTVALDFVTKLATGSLT